MSQHAPILGKLGPEYMGGPFRAFDTGLVRGLAVRDGRHLQFLVLLAHHPNHGETGTLLVECQRVYDQITVWEVLNPILERLLYKRGFVRSLRPTDAKDTPDHVVFEWLRPV